MNDLSNVTAAILAGGLGTRLRSVVDDRSKVMAQVRGRPFLEYLLDQVVYWGITQVVLCIGYLGEQVESHFRDRYGTARLRFSKEESPLGTAGALRFALPLLKSDCVLVLNGDSFCKADLYSFWLWHRAKGAEATVLLVESSDTKWYGRVEIDDNGRILRFDEKDDKNEPGWINAGVYLIKRDLLQTIPEGKGISLEREIFSSWIGCGLYGYGSKGVFLDIGTPESYRLAEKFFAESILK